VTTQHQADIIVVRVESSTMHSPCDARPPIRVGLASFSLRRPAELHIQIANEKPRL